MGLLKDLRRKIKRARKSAPPVRKLPERELAPVAEIVEQGMLVADVAVRMTVKNQIIMNALKRHLDYNPQQVKELVRAAVKNLAAERERDADHIARVRGEITRTGHSALSESEYGTQDSKTLRHRQEVYAGVAQQLSQLVDDDAYLSQTAKKATALAWAEIGDSLKERASHPYYSGGHTEDYRLARDDRIRDLIEKDLTQLVREVKGSKAAKQLTPLNADSGPGSADNTKSQKSVSWLQRILGKLRVGK